MKTFIIGPFIIFGISILLLLIICIVEYIKNRKEEKNRPKTIKEQAIEAYEEKIRKAKKCRDEGIVKPNNISDLKIVCGIDMKDTDCPYCRISTFSERTFCTLCPLCDRGEWINQVYNQNRYHWGSHHCCSGLWSNVALNLYEMTWNDFIKGLERILDYIKENG